MPIDEKLLLEKNDELLLRQVNIQMMSKGRPSTKIFTPTQADAGLLSANRERLMSAKEAYDRYVKKKGDGKCGGVWGVSIKEFGTLSALTYSDPIVGSDSSEQNDAHVLVDFTDVDSEMVGVSAYAFAMHRGRQYP